MLWEKRRCNYLFNDFSSHLQVILAQSWVKDGSLITCGEGVEDTHIFDGIFVPLSDLCKECDPHSRTSEEIPHSFF